MEFKKKIVWRSKDYLQWIREQPSCFSGNTYNIQAHHIIGCGMGGVMGGKVSDLFTIPLTAEEHAELHRNAQQFPIDQKTECLRMIEKALEEGILRVNENPG